MAKCPKCDRSIKPEALECPYCRNPLKAFGHPGIPVYQSLDDSWLCDRCYYHFDDSCNYPQRPYAKSCTMFHDKEKPLVEEPIHPSSRGSLATIKFWLRRHQRLSIILILIAISILLAVV